MRGLGLGLGRGRQALGGGGGAGVSAAEYQIWRIEATQNGGDGAIGLDLQEIKMVREGINVIGSGVASAISNFSGAPAAHAFDGNTSTYWAQADATFPAWIQYDFGAPQKVDHVAIRPRYDTRSPRSFTIKGSNDDGATFDTLETVTGISAWEEYYKNFRPRTPVIPKKYRIRATSVNAGGLLDFNDVQFRTAAGNDVTVYDSAEASSEFSGLPAIRAFDGDTLSRWASNGFGSEEWLSCEAPADVPISAVAIRVPTANRTPNNWAWEVSEDGGTSWEVLDTFATPSGWSSNVRRVFAVTPAV